MSSSKEINITTDDVAGIGIIENKFTVCINDQEIEWLIFDDKVVKMILDFFKLNG